MFREEKREVAPDTIPVSRADLALIRAAAMLVEYTDVRRRAGHLIVPLRELAERIESALGPDDLAA